MQKATIASLFMADDAARQAGLERARRAAATIKPWILPMLGQSAEGKLPETYQSLGARGFTNLTGKMLMALYPPEEAWFLYEAPEEVRFDPRVTPEFLQRLNDIYFEREITITSLLESATSGDVLRDPVTFRTNKRNAIDSFLITGESLERINDDYTLTVWRRTNYVTLRDTEGRVLYHIVVEKKDPLELTEEQLEAADLKLKDLKEQSTSERMRDLHTRVEWSPLSKSWVIEQEMNGRLLNESEEPFSPFVSTPFELVAGENYGRGLGELLLGDLNSTNELNKRMLDFAEISSKILAALDYHCQAKPGDLTKPTGGTFRARVSQGQIQDIAFLKPDKLGDFQVVNAALERVESRLGKSLLLDSESVRDSERTTKFEIENVSLQELNGALGGIYPAIADRNQIPFVARVGWMAERDKILKPIPRNAGKIVAITGITALARQERAGRALRYAQGLNELGPEGARRINIGVLAKMLQRTMRIQEPGLVKTDEQLAREDQQALALQAQAQAAEKAIDVAGNVVQNQATQGQQQ